MLILLRGLLADAHTHMATIDDLKSNPTSVRISLALTSQPHLSQIKIWDDSSFHSRDCSTLSYLARSFIEMDAVQGRGIAA